MIFREIPAIPCADQARDENRMFWQPGYEEPDGTIAEDNRDMLGDLHIQAVLAARQARFEHGETPNPADLRL